MFETIINTQSGSISSFLSRSIGDEKEGCVILYMRLKRINGSDYNSARMECCIFTQLQTKSTKGGAHGRKIYNVGVNILVIKSLILNQTHSTDQSFA